MATYWFTILTCVCVSILTYARACVYILTLVLYPPEESYILITKPDVRAGGSRRATAHLPVHIYILYASVLSLCHVIIMSRLLLGVVGIGSFLVSYVIVPPPHHTTAISGTCWICAAMRRVSLLPPFEFPHQYSPPPSLSIYKIQPYPPPLFSCVLRLCEVPMRCKIRSVCTFCSTVDR